MKRRIKILSLVAVLSTFATSCIMYQPQAVDIPLINHQNDLRIDGSIGMGYLLGLFPTVNVTSSYGFNNWGAAQLHANWDLSRGYYLQAGVGGYVPIDKFVIEGYLGYGYGYKYYCKDDTVPNPKEFFGNYQLPYAQINMGWVDLAKGHIDLGLGLKTGYFIPDITDRWTSHPDVKYITKESFLFEPQLFFRVGGEHLKFVIRVSMSIFPEEDDGPQVLYAPFGASVGLNYRF
ncbi:MAG: hypothetical protein J6T33_10540 [Bacteroidales bacterium]|nr:hypothetical protein [Bacteroidales bacterium]